MPTVSELKKRASSYEQEGQVEKALAIYDHILKHLEGKPTIAKVVIPLFVKVGDLRRMLDHSADAVAAYERAAEHYALQGSSQRVHAMCAKILDIQPGRLGVHAKFARQLLEHGHVMSATEVLVEYAQDAQLDKAVEVLDELEGRPDDEVRPMLESLLDSIERGEPLKAEETARRVSRRLSIATDAIVGELANIQIETSSGEDVNTIQATEADHTSEPLTPELIDLGLTTGELATEPKTQPEEEEEEEEEAPTPESIDLGLTTGELATEPETQPQEEEAPPLEPSVPAAPPEPRTADHSPAVLVGGGFIVGLLSGVGLAMAGVIPTGAGNGSEAQIASTQPPVQQTDAPAPATPIADSIADAEPPPTPTDPVSVDSTATAVPIMVEGLQIESRVAVESQGRPGHIVVQLLNWADPITIESYLLPDDTTGASQAEPLRVTVTPNNTVVGIMRFNGYQVFASGVMPEDSLRSFLSRLVESGN